MVSGPLVMELPKCSVITPTWNRHKYLLERCIPSVRAQEYVSHEHIVFSDGPDSELWSRLCQLEDGRSPQDPQLLFGEMGYRRGEKHWGAAVRRQALHMATGDLVGYLDDDDAFRRRHLAVHAQVLTANPAIGFTVSQMMVHNNWGAPPDVLGGEDHGGIRLGNTGTPMIVHRRELLDIATWGEDHIQEDWNLISAWLAAGVSYLSIGEVTVDVWPGRYE